MSKADHTTIDRVTVVETIAAQRGIDSDELPPPALQTVIDLDALERLFIPSADGTPLTDGRVQFVYRGHVVTVESDGDVRVDT